ncbi:bacteriochlorophyll 4-vinyl reductase [Heliorestis acidaminivorans]|uniref:Bacteriochlorophyll 4-vinyl reductase n=1 Tax=Heliorestis acidaminivorans TaxID=553427 RepID=A0A6I0ERR4_9FIRM|nr:bacteriochlorophyll 4-vinyl reductase [Heliorestis acidaminivorans]KAB2953059.1 bacteriochlorophyll 4-vinyl reductase [Heliorestis acidaminivorans]
MKKSKIGPNSIIQTIRVHREKHREEEVKRLLHKAGLEKYIEQLPTEMVHEEEFNQLVHALIELYGFEETTRILKKSGQYTATYLLENRIPKVAQWLFGIVPRSTGMKLFLKAISQNAWTFVGSGNFTYEVKKDKAYLQIVNSINAKGLRSEQPICTFYTGTFEKLFQTLIERNIKVAETKCSACGDDFCYFEVK